MLMNTLEEFAEKHFHLNKSPDLGRIRDELRNGTDSRSGNTRFQSAMTLILLQTTPVHHLTLEQVATRANALPNPTALRNFSLKR